MMRLWSRRRMAAAGIVLLLALGYAGFHLFRHRSHATRSAEGAVYYCPMHPAYTSDRPGDCPICNMKLVRREEAPDAAPSGHAGHAAVSLEAICRLHNCPKLHEGRPCPMMVVSAPGEKVTCPICGTHIAGGAAAKAPVEGYAAVLLSPQKRQVIGVRTAPAEVRPLSRTIRTVGRIAHDPELYRTQQEYLHARKAFQQAQSSGNPESIRQAKDLVESAQIRLRLQGLSDELIKETAGREGPDRSLLLSDPDGSVWLYAPVYEFDLPLIRSGQKIFVEVPAAPERLLEGDIRAVDPVLDPTTRSARIRAQLRDPEKVLRPEMFVNVSIQMDLGRLLAVPEEAVFYTGTRAIVFVDKGQGLLEPRQVTVGAAAEGWTEIREGVHEGEPVVVSGNFLLDSESRLKSALEGMTPGEGSAEHRHGP